MTVTIEPSSPVEADANAAVDRSWSGSWCLYLVATVLTALSILAMDEADPDLWGHVQYGKEFISEGRLETRSTWNYTALGYRWVNHENLAEIALALADSAGGGPGLILLKLAVSLTLLGVLIWRLADRGTHPLTIGIVLVVLAQSIAFHWHFRPQIFGYALFAIMLALLDWCFQGWAGSWWARPGWHSDDAAAVPVRSWSNWWRVPNATTPEYSWFRMRQLYWLLPLGVVWVNTHGSFAAGVCVACTYLGLRGLESLLTYRWYGWGRFRRFALVALGVLVVVLINPYGYQLITWLLEDVYLPRPEIEDWERLPLFTAEGIGFWLMLGSSLLATWRTRRVDFTHTVILLLLTWQSVSHIRHLVWLAIAWSFWMSGPLDRLLRGFLRDIAAQRAAMDGVQTERPSPVLTGLLCVWIAYVGGMLWPRVTSLKVDRQVYPVAAMQYLADQQLSGRTVVTFNWAQYALGCFAAAEMPSRVAVDGRLRTCYPQEVIDIYFDFLFGHASSVPRYRSPNSGPLDPALALKHESPELVLISRKQQPSVLVMEQHRDTWTLLYQDSLAQVWGRRDLFDDPASLRYVPTDERQITNDSQQGFATWPAVPTVAHRAPLAPVAPVVLTKVVNVDE